MARREVRPAPREDSKREGGKSGGLLTGLLLGLVIGLVAAAGLAWYFNFKKPEFKAAEQAPKIDSSAQSEAEQPAEPLKTSPPPARKPAETAPRAAKTHEDKPVKPGTPEQTAKPEEPRAPIVERKQAKASEPPSRVPLTFYGILPGEKPAKPVEPPKPKELWWLQVAALKSPVDADKLKARLAMLGLEVATQKVESAGQSLYRVRVGPYKRDEDAFADLDTLAANNYEPRLLKEPVTGANP
jgi:cell division protein FtsN